MDPQNPGTRYETPSSGSAYPPMNPHHAQPVAGAQVDIGKRVIAALIDFVGIGIVVGVLNVVLGIALGRFGLLAAGLAGTAAVLLRDVAMQGRSPGKKIMGLALANVTGGPITPELSIKRNSTLALGMLGSAVSAVPFVGWLVAMVLWFAGFAASVYELYLVVSNKPRFGDQLAGTRVVMEGQAAIAS